MLLPLLECQHRSQGGTAKAEGRAGVDLDDPYLLLIECAEQARDTQTTQSEVRHAIESRGHDGAVPHSALYDAITQRSIAQTQSSARLIRQRCIKANDNLALA